MKKRIIAFIAGWILCGFLASGIWYANFTDRFPSLDSPLNRRDNLAAGICFGAVLGPIGLFVSYFSSGFAYHGMRWTGGPKGGH